MTTLSIREYDISTTYKATVVESNRITPDNSPEEVRDILIELPAHHLTPKLGMNIGVLVEGPHDFGNPHHLRLYSVTDFVYTNRDSLQLAICVKRCNYVDEVNGELYQGVASNFLCDLSPGDHLTLTGPYGSPFSLPQDDKTNILMIATGTGIAPFRAFVKQIYQTGGGWNGKVRLFYGARSGLEMLYMNDRRNDFANYYDFETFRAFKAVSPRPHLDAPVDMARTLGDNAAEVWEMIQNPETFVYVAGLDSLRGQLDIAFGEMAGSAERWRRKRAELEAGGRWQELLY